jgi:hypothetical protein
VATRYAWRWSTGAIVVVCVAGGLARASCALATWSAPKALAALSTPAAVNPGSLFAVENAKGDSIVGWSERVSRSSPRDQAWVVTRKGEGAWSKPARLGPPQTGSSAIRAVVAATGETTVAWSEQRRIRGRTRVEVLVRSRRANRWEREHVLAAVSAATGNMPVVSPAPQVALSATGAPVVLFNIGRQAGVEAVEIDRRARDGRWPRPRIIAHTAYCTEAGLATDSAGETLLTWTHGNPSSPGTLTRVEAVTLSPKLRPQSKPVAVSPTGRFAYAPMIAVNARGDGTLIWALEGHESQPRNAPLEAATRTSGHRFTRRAGQRVIAGDGSPGGVAVDSHGEATAVFSAGRAEVATRPLAGRWGAPAPISITPASEPVLGQDATEDLLAAWTTELPLASGQTYPRYAVQASIRIAGGVWQTPTIISPLDSGAAAVSIGASNHALAVWGNETSHRLESADFLL